MAEQVSQVDERACAVRRLSIDPTAAGEARRWSAETLARWDLPDLTDEVQTVVTELVTNSMQAGAGEIGVLIERHGDTVEIHVWDDALGEPRLRKPDVAAEAGRGLFLVDALCSAWGHHAGKVTWARLGCSSTE